MQEITLLLQLAAEGVALFWLVTIALKPQRNALYWSWAAFCGSMAMVGIGGAFSAQLGEYRMVFQAAGSAGCGTAWLFSRALFRERRAIEWPHIATVLVIMAPSVIARILWGLEAETVIGQERLDAFTEGAFGAQTLLSSTILVLTFFEAYRGWAPHLTAEEKRMRVVFGASFASAVLVCVAWADYTEPQVRLAVTSTCAFVLLLVGSYTIRHRERSPVRARDPEAIDPEDAALAIRIEGLVRSEQLYLESELKVADLATRLREPDYKVSRAIATALGFPNFNQFINGFRIDHASRLLADPAQADTPVLTIALDSGFASPGPFNRAFKARHGVTPREYRRAGGDALSPATA